MEENLKRALQISRGDLMTFIERPISAVFVALSLVVIGIDTDASCQEIAASQSREAWYRRR